MHHVALGSWVWEHSALCKEGKLSESQVVRLLRLGHPFVAGNERVKQRCDWSLDRLPASQEQQQPTKAHGNTSTSGLVGDQGFKSNLLPSVLSAPLASLVPSPPLPQPLQAPKHPSDPMAYSNLRTKRSILGEEDGKSIERRKLHWMLPALPDPMAYSNFQKRAFHSKLG